MINNIISMGLLILAVLISWYGHVIFAIFFSLLAGALSLKDSRRYRKTFFAICISLFCLAVYRTDSWELKKKSLVVRAEQLLLEQIASGKPLPDLLRRSDEWKQFAEMNPAYRVIVDRDSDSKVIRNFVISVGFRNYWKLEQDFDSNGQLLPSVRWIAVGDDVEVVQKELDLFLAELEHNKHSKQ
jgi:hypothetical protein